MWAWRERDTGITPFNSERQEATLVTELHRRGVAVKTTPALGDLSHKGSFLVHRAYPLQATCSRPLPLGPRLVGWPPSEMHGRRGRGKKRRGPCVLAPPVSAGKRQVTFAVCWPKRASFWAHSSFMKGSLPRCHTLCIMGPRPHQGVAGNQVCKVVSLLRSSPPPTGRIVWKQTPAVGPTGLFTD